ncbi:iron-sulfur cluster-binding protein [bacterium]|nr:iron-sulfur cluster-binding protein [bacterium]RQV95500.1 MAG: iron-sulfur cluster-binding protein [bacterium]
MASPKYIKKYVRQALKDAVLRSAVDNATQSTVEARQEIIDQIPHWEGLRQKCHAIKKEVIDHLDRYLEQFEDQCIQNGIQVHWAIDGREAQDIILGIAREHHVQKVVKSKSLTTEEIQLNQKLIENGIETLETDLGEYIIQLMGQIPSHLVIPALHLTRKQIAKLFHEKIGNPYTEDPTELLKVARKKLREKFLSADMGITGVNFALAETGTICVIENEANAHLTLSLPNIHVAVMGIEKLIPGQKDLSYFLNLLAPNATGQKSSTFINLIGGPSREKYGEGPKEVHIVLLDNGRSNLLKDPKMREILSCIRCGACLNVCPVYQQIGGHAYGWVYMGPIGINLIPQYLGKAVGRYAPYLCSLCKACFETCPVRINLPGHILQNRKDIVQSGHSQWVEKIGMSVWGFCAKHPLFYRFVTWFPGKLQKLLLKEKPFLVPGYTRERAFASFDSKGFRKQFHRYLHQQDSFSKRS